MLFHSPPGVLFTFPSRYFPLSVTEEYLALRGGPRAFHQGSTCLDVLWILLASLAFRVRGSHPLLPVFPVPFHYAHEYLTQSEPLSARTQVWALPLSLAATHRIDVSFSSSGYLDVSVHRVSPRWPMDSAIGTCSAHVGSPIQISADPCVCATPRSFSQLITSFIGSQCQGIRPVLLVLF